MRSCANSAEPSKWPGAGSRRGAVAKRKARILPDDGIFRAILLVLVASAIAGAGLMVTGEYLFHSPAMVTVGTGAALFCGALYFFFRLLGKRELRRRNEIDAKSRNGGPGEA